VDVRDCLIVAVAILSIAQTRSIENGLAGVQITAKADGKEVAGRVGSP
jgi:hypothetical protein